MPKTDIKKIENEDIAELSDESLDRDGNETMCFSSGHTIACTSPTD